jgi:hypothetical protein
VTKSNKIILDEIIRAKLLINYQTSKTLEENLLFINEQPGTGGMLYPSEDRIKRESEEYKKETYPLYCKYPDKALTPIQHIKTAGDSKIEGEEALVTSTGGTKFCLYRQAGGDAIWVPSDAEVTFTTFDWINYNVDKFFEKYPKYMDKNRLIDNFTQLFFPNGRESVVKFSFDPYFYRAKLYFDSKTKRWWFKEYFEESSGTKYEEPIWNDPRNDYKRFIDDFGTVIYFSIIAASALIPMTQSGIIAAVMIDLAASGVIAQRDLEKGQNISAVFSVLLALIPLANLSHKWIGVSDEVLKSMSKKFQDSYLSRSSPPSAWVKFYKNNLNEAEQLAMSKLLKYKKEEIELMAKDIAKNLSQMGKYKKAETISDILSPSLLNMVKTNPEVLKSIPFVQRLGPKVLTVIGVSIIINYVLNKWKGEEWNDSSKEIFEKCHSLLSPELEQYLFIAATVNAMKANELFSAPELREATENAELLMDLKIDESIKKMAIDTTIVSTINEVTETTDSTVVKLPDFSSYIKQVINTDSIGLSEYREKGYMPINETASDTSEFDYNDILVINNNPWVKKIMKDEKN